MARFDLSSLADLVARWTPDDHVELGGIEETGSAFRLGALVVHKREPLWMCGDDAGELRDMTHLRLLDFELPGVALAGVGAIFHIDGDPADPNGHQERLIGWVRPERRAELHSWLAWLNGHIHELIVDAKGHENPAGAMGGEEAGDPD